MEKLFYCINEPGLYMVFDHVPTQFERDTILFPNAAIELNESIETFGNINKVKTDFGFYFIKEGKDEEKKVVRSKKPNKIKHLTYTIGEVLYGRCL